MKYVFVFNPQAKRYSREAEGHDSLPGFQHLTVRSHHGDAYRPETAGRARRYVIADLAHCTAGADCLVVVGGDGTVNIVVSASCVVGYPHACHFGVILYGTGNNLVHSFGLERERKGAVDHRAGVYDPSRYWTGQPAALWCQ